MTQVVLNGNTYSDDGTSAKDMNSGGHRTHFLPMLGDTLVEVADAAASAATAAASAATAIAAPGTSATSTTSNSIGTGSKTFTIQAGKSIVVGMFVQCARTAAPANWMHGVVVAYNSGTGQLDFTVGAMAGSGTFTDWTISLSGPGVSNLANTDLSGMKNATYFAEYDNGNSGASKTVTLTNGQKQKITLTANTTLTISFAGAGVGHYQLRLIQDGTGGRTVTWSGLSASRWLGSPAAPAINAAVSGETIVSIFWDGTNATQSAVKVGTT